MGCAHSQPYRVQYYKVFNDTKLCALVKVKQNRCVSSMRVKNAKTSVKGTFGSVDEYERRTYNFYFHPFEPTPMKT